MKSRQDILRFLAQNKAELDRRFGVRRIGLYGSYATGMQQEDSDVDLVVELKEPRFDDLAGLHIFVEQALGYRVDILRLSKNLRTRFIQRIEEEALYV
ncbi:MAG: nucleotidyltransferase domain-containing protein [Gemmatimonadota bacterium]|nr:nucleotidyltransferase domain-containing protein [Gemmatimonadota bacterium]